MGSRQIDDRPARQTADKNIYIKIEGDPKEDYNLQWTKLEYKAMLNGGEQLRCVLYDPHFTILNTREGAMGGRYYRTSRRQAPVNVKTRLLWAPRGGERGDLKTGIMNHAMVGLAPYQGEGTFNQANIEFLAVDHASWHLTAGDAGGHHYKGNVKSVIQQVVNKYSRGKLKLDFRSDTTDNVDNSWWQYRLDPKSFITSLLDWSSSINNNKTRWFIYPDDEENPGKFIIVEQGDMEAKHRANYDYRAFGKEGAATGDIVDWEMIGNNALQLMRHKIVTNGISAVSGAYYDNVIDKDQNFLFVGDTQTPNKLKPKTRDSNAFSRPDPDADPLEQSVGWTTIPAIPEFSAGDLGVRYDKYMDGRARNAYLALDNLLMRCRFRVKGHHIWYGSDGLGVDTIFLKMQTAHGEPHFLQGIWIVYGYHHTITQEDWWTDLYCARIDHDATAKPVGNEQQGLSILRAVGNAALRGLGL